MGPSSSPLSDWLAQVRLLQDRGELVEALAAVQHLLHTAVDNAFDYTTAWTARRINAELLFDLSDTTQVHRLTSGLYQQLTMALPPRHPATICTAVLLAGISHPVPSATSAITSARTRTTRHARPVHHQQHP